MGLSSNTNAAATSTRRIKTASFFEPYQIFFDIKLAKSKVPYRIAIADLQIRLFVTGNKAHMPL